MQGKAGKDPKDGTRKSSGEKKMCLCMDSDGKC